jgi:CBS domain containing-hemolysin-like protein
VSEAGPLAWTVVLLLAATSACLSGSETALFSLNAQERRRAGPVAARLLENPQRLLVTVLVANLTVNLLFFLFAARLQWGSGPYARLWTGLASLVALLIVGEVVPKTIALRSRLTIARLGAPFLSAVELLLSPVHRSADRALELVYRVLGDAGRAEHGITTDTLASVLESSAEQGLLLDGEAEFLAGVVELSEVRVREIMTPRVDMLLLDLTEESSARPAVVARAVAARAAWVVVVDGTPDRVLGRVRVRDLLMRPTAPVRELLQVVRFVPEVATLVHLMEFLRRERIAQAVVVDEWGGTAGQVRMEDVIEEIVGDLRVEGESQERAVTRLDEQRFRVLGNLSIRDWNEHFGHSVVATEFETVGGLVTALLARIPRSGDVVRSGPLEFRVDEVRRRRIHSLVISLGATAEASA